MNNVLLVNTSYRENPDSQYSTFGPPMGLLAIASALKADGYAVELIDPQIHADYQERLRTALGKPQLFVGMSTYLGENIKHALEISRLIKREKPELPLVLGGPLASSIPEIFFREMPVDYIVMGAGEVTVVRIADALKMSGDPLSIPNISYMRNGKVTAGELFVFEGCLDDLPLIDLEEWGGGIPALDSIPLITSRGCRRGCAFCYNTFTGKKKYYLRSAESVISEMERWYRRFNISTFQFFDDNFLLDPGRALAILDEMARRNWKVARLFGHLNEFDRVSPEQLTGSVTWIVMCIESASVRIQKLLNKPINIGKALDLIERIAAQEIAFITAFMFGLPTETDEDIRLSIELADRIRSIKETNISMCYIYAPQPKDGIVSQLGPDNHIEFTLDALSEVEVVPVPPDNKLDLRLRPWMSNEDRSFYLDFVQVWQYHFAHHEDPGFDLSRIYAGNERVRSLFRNIAPPCRPARIPGLYERLKLNIRHLLDRFMGR